MFSRYSKLTATITPLKTDKMKRLSYLLFVILFTTFITSCNHVNQKPEYGEAAKELVKLLDGNPDLKAMLIESLEKAHVITSYSIHYTKLYEFKKCLQIKASANYSFVFKMGKAFEPYGRKISNC